ncbi:type II secretion system secretin GspD [Pseudomonas agarici]|uniref:type II secretion system secretin GspD n=1 Tax=Pseudomonas agarici TaxID=46677 RepID=UPI00030552ED|nr:type II secretion system secretin GspD [Pseudomonas agarici]SEK42425.1 type II secretion system protein D (GspD) [Pseudomonas agarici]
MIERIVCPYLIGCLLLSGCVAPVTDDSQDDSLIRQGLAGTGADRPPLATAMSSASLAVPLQAPAASGSQIIRGNQGLLARDGATVKPHPVPAGDNGTMFNFAGVPIQAVINTILGDVLKQNYSIGQGVTGDVTFSTSRPVDKAQAFSILETLLSWTNNAIIRQGERYLILPANQAVAGQLTPRQSIQEPGSGLSARFFVLDYISPLEMQKLLKPFARENAFLVVDTSRNVLVMAGTPEELNNYQQTINTFDVNWLQGMSIGVFGLKRANVSQLMPELDRLFGAQSGTPLAGMLRFLPIERTNAIVAISPQAEYLNDVRRWIDTIDQGGGDEPQMYVYDVRNMKATDLARYLRQIYNDESVTEEAAAQVAPGLRTVTLTSNGFGGSSGGASGIGNGLPTNGSGGPGLPPPMSSSADTRIAPERTSDDLQLGAPATNNAARGPDNTNNPTNSVRITAQKSSNQLLVRSRPTQWAEIQSAIQRLDNPPMQVQIETRILEVGLSGSLNLGVQWYLGRLAANSATKGIENVSGSQGALGRGGAALGATDSLFYSFVSNNLQVALHALETNGNTRVLSAPSLVVMNNQQAQIQVGDNIPINQTTINTNTTTISTSSVQYIQTGVILDVVPRINPGGLVYLDIQQQVSDASNTVDANGNPTISTRAVSTQVAVQSGQTILLGGLIKQNENGTDNSVPYLGRIPGLQWLFGNTQRQRGRSELIVLITPRVITGNGEARQITDEYRQQLQLMTPIKANH